MNQMVTLTVDEVAEAIAKAALAKAGVEWKKFALEYTTVGSMLLVVEKQVDVVIFDGRPKVLLAFAPVGEHGRQVQCG